MDNCPPPVRQNLVSVTYKRSASIETDPPGDHAFVVVKEVFIIKTATLSRRENDLTMTITIYNFYTTEMWLPNTN